MVVKSLIEMIKGNPLNKLTTRELRTEQARLKDDLKRERDGINNIEKQKRKLFREGVGADVLKKKMLVQDIGAIDMEAKLKLKIFTTIHRQLRFITNLLTVKNYERQLRQMGLWKKLTSMSREKLQAYLIRVNLDGKEFDEVVADLNRPFETEVDEMPDELAEDEKRIFETWENVESGALDPETAERELSVEREPGDMEVG